MSESDAEENVGRVVSGKIENSLGKDILGVTGEKIGWTNTTSHDLDILFDTDGAIGPANHIVIKAKVTQPQMFLFVNSTKDAREYFYTARLLDGSVGGTNLGGAMLAPDSTVTTRPRIRVGTGIIPDR